MPSYDQSPRYKVKLRCLACNHKYSRIVRSLSSPDPACPRCKTLASAPRGMDFSRPPPSIGGSPTAKAVDFTENLVAREYGMSDLRTASRAGDVSFPKLPPAQQSRADSFFSASRALAPANPALAAQAARASMLASSGALAHNEDARFVDRALANAPRPRIKIVAGGRSD